MASTTGREMWHNSDKQDFKNAVKEFKDKGVEIWKGWDQYEHKYFISNYKVGGGGDMKNMEESLRILHEEAGFGCKCDNYKRSP